MGATKTQITAAIAGARGGKTEVGRWIFLDWALMQPGYLPEDYKQGKPYTMAVWAPTFPMLSQVVEPAIMNAVPDELKIQHRRSTPRQLLMHGIDGKTLIYFLSGHDPDRSRGLQLYRGWIDECALVEEAMFEEAQTRLADRHGKLLLTSTPIGPNWLKKRIADMAPKEPEKITFVCWRTVDNPYFPKDELEFKRRTMNPRYFKRTYEASFEAFEGMIFEDWNRTKNVIRPCDWALNVVPANRWFGVPNERPNQLRIDRVIAGVDWGFQSKSAIAIVGITSQGDYILLDEVYESGLTHYGSVGDSLAKRALAMQSKWGVTHWYCGPDQPQSIRAWKSQHKLHALLARDEVLAGLHALLTFVRDDEKLGHPRFRVYYGPSFLNEIEMYQWAHGPETTAAEKPLKKDDHMIDAVRYAVFSDTVSRFVREPNFRWLLPHDVQLRIRGLGEVHNVRHR